MRLFNSTVSVYFESHRVPGCRRHSLFVSPPSFVCAALPIPPAISSPLFVHPRSQHLLLSGPGCSWVPHSSSSAGKVAGKPAKEDRRAGSLVIPCKSIHAVSWHFFPNVLVLPFELFRIAKQLIPFVSSLLASGCCRPRLHVLSDRPGLIARTK